MGQLAERVVLIHELGQLGGAEEFLHGSRHRFDIDQRLCGNRAEILCGHSFTYHTLHSGQSDPVLVLKKLTHAADTTVAEMVNIVLVADVILQMHIVVNGSEDIISGDMLRNQLVNARLKFISDVLGILILLKDLTENRIIYFFCDAEFLCLFLADIDPLRDVDLHVGENLDIALRRLNPDIGNSGILDLICECAVYLLTCLRNDLARFLADHILREHMACDTVAECKLFIEFITAYLSQVIAARIEEHAVNQALRIFHSERLAGTDLLIEFKKAFLIVCGSVLGEAGKDLGLFAKVIKDFRVGSDAKRTDQNGDRRLAGTVHTGPENVI